MPRSEFDDPEFLTRLRQTDAKAWRALIRRFHATMVGVAGAVIGSRAQGEEVVQDSWLAAYASIARFEGRSTLSTWLFSIVLNAARTRARAEGRLVGLPALLDGSPPNERAVPAAAFKSDGHWIEAPRLWDNLDPERIIAGRQLWALAHDAIARLPAGQRAVILLRDMEDKDAEETCALLEISAENQRVLLHRARARIRQAIDLATAPRAIAPRAKPAPPPRRSQTATRSAPSLLAVFGRMFAIAYRRFQWLRVSG